MQLQLSRCQYFDSVEWERAEEMWKRHIAKALSHPGIEIILAVCLIEYGEVEMKKISLPLREQAYELHKGDKV